MVTLTAPDADLEFPGAALQQTVESLGLVPGIALARIWLVQSNSQCVHCRSANLAKASELSLHLVASHGRSRNESRPEVWNRTSGGFHQLSLHSHSQKIGRIASTGEPLLVRNSVAHSSLLNPDWVEDEAIQSFFGYPLIHAGHIQGVLAVFSRRELDDRDVSYLRQIAASVTASLAYASQFAAYQRRLRQVETQNLRLRTDLQSNNFAGPLVAVGAASQKWDQQIHLAAQHRQPVLISGGYGVGKEFTARLIHERSSLQATPFIKVDADSLDASALEESFADPNSSGTVFFDAIEQTPAELQERLACLVNSSSRSNELAEGEPQNPRVIASTTADLRSQVASGNFLQDLFCSITVTEIQVPALTERHEDLAKLASDLLRAICRREHRPELTLVDSAIQRLKSYSWPGNVRQLRRVLESCLWRGPSGFSEVDTSVLSNLLPGDDLPVAVLTADEIRRRERANIEACLRQCEWKVYGPGGAAEMLGLKPTSLMYRMKALKIHKPAK